MRRFIFGALFLLSLLSVATTGLAQSCLPGTTTLTTQGAVDSFPILHPGCTEIEGTLIIQSTAVTQLDSLYPITRVHGDLVIDQCENLTSIQGLAGLDSVGGSLLITSNKNLPSLQGLENLKTVGSSLKIKVNNYLSSLAPLAALDSIGYNLEIIYNPALQDLQGLENISHLGKGLYVAANNGLKTLAGLDNLQTVGGPMFLTSNDSLTDITALMQLTSIGDSLLINDNKMLASLHGLNNLVSLGHKLQMVNNDQLTDLTGLEGLQVIPGDLEINYMDNLKSLDGIQNIKKVGGFLAVFEDPALTDISALSGLDSIMGAFLFIARDTSLTSLAGLDNLKYIGGNSIAIQHNPNLSICGTPAICHLIRYADFTDIFDNAPGCGSVQEIELTCGVPAITGRVLADLNGDCQPDSGDVPLPRLAIIVYQNNDTLVALTDEQGYYRVFAQPGPYQVDLRPEDAWISDCVSLPVSGDLMSNADVDTIDFALRKSADCQAMRIDVTGTPPAACSPIVYVADYCNTGTQPLATPQVQVTFSPEVTVDSADVSFAATNNTFVFDGDSLPLGACKRFKIYGHLDCAVPPQRAICAEAVAIPATTCQVPDPAWSGASVRVRAQCDADSVRFTIQNAGTGDMQAAQSYDIIIEDWVVLRTDVQLSAGDSVTLPAYKKNGATYIIRADQVDHHPGRSHPIVALEGCGTNAAGTFSTGSVLQYPEDDADPFVSTDCQEVVGTGPMQFHYPKGFGPQHLIERNRDIEYRTVFQNATTDTIAGVVIEQIISPHLDITSFRPEASSHPYTIDISGDTVRMHFQKIFLPPLSSGGITGATGYVKYRLSQKPDLPNGTVIANAAHIHYSNHPVQETNIVFNTIGENFIPVGTTEPAPRETALTVSPNPCTDHVRFIIKTPFRKGRIWIYDTSGKEMMKREFTDPSFTIRTDTWPPAVYYFKIKLDRRPPLHGRLQSLGL